MSFEETTDDPGQCIRHKKGTVKIKHTHIHTPWIPSTSRQQVVLLNVEGSALAL